VRPPEEGYSLAMLVAEIVRALTNLRRGTYGDCERCGQPIPLARLRVLPEARYDMAHEAQMEASRQLRSI
jgi:RNA polymerase-binding transcription factor DksA